MSDTPPPGASRGDGTPAPAEAPHIHPTTSGPPGLPGLPAAFPTRIGRYTILRILGEGGMGTVYAAQQESPNRTVALKVIKSGRLSPALLRRFEHESQVLGRLQHPGIAQVYEAGTVPNEHGQPMPFFAMEYIRGMPLTLYAAKRNLSIRERLDLLARVCDAVYHAHQKGVIHRDLKPGNILVDESGQPKVLDFGVARATDSDVQTTTVQTDIGQLIGTVPYMSPEQVSGDPQELDTRSDVYALGVIGYELLAGRLPYDLTRKMIHEAVRVIKEEEPTRLSSINRRLRGDVETIVAKALEKDKARRYQSAESLASDIRRYLKSEPIAARPASTWYQVQKFSSRNRGLVAGVAAAFVLLVAGILGTSLALSRALRAETSLTSQLAETKKARKHAEDTVTFIVKVMQTSDPRERGKMDITIAQAMENARRDIDSGAFKDDPETEAELRNTIAQILQNNGHVAEAEPLLVAVLATYQRLHANDHPGVLRGLNNLAWVRLSLGRAGEAEPMWVQAVEMHKRLYKGGDTDLLPPLLGNLAVALRTLGRAAEAEPIAVQSLRVRQRLYAGDHPDVAQGLAILATVWTDLGRSAAAEPLLVQAVAMYQRIYTGDHPDFAACLARLAGVRNALGHQIEAEPLVVQAVEMYERMYKGDHPDLADALVTLATVRQALGRVKEAEEACSRALDMFRRLYPGDHPSVATALGSLAFMRQALGRVAEAEPLCVQSLEMRQRLYPGAHPEVAAALNNLALCRKALGRLTEAEPLYVQALEMYRRIFGGDQQDVAQCLHNLATVRQLLGRVVEAEPLYTQSLEMYERLFPGDHPDVYRGLASLAKARGLLGRVREAEELYIRAIEMLKRLPGGDNPGVAAALYEFATRRESQGSLDKAEQLYLQALEVYERVHKGDHADTVKCLESLAYVRRALGRLAEAEPLLVRVLEMRQRLFAGDHVEIVKSLNNLAVVRLALGRLADASPVAEQALAMGERLLPPDHPYVKAARSALADCREALAAQQPK